MSLRCTGRLSIILSFYKLIEIQSSITQILSSNKFGNLHTDNTSQIVERILQQIGRGQGFPQEQVIDQLYMAIQLYRSSNDNVKKNLSLLIAHLSSKLVAINDDEEFSHAN